MSARKNRADIPRHIVIATGGLLLLSVLMAAFSSQTGIGRTPDTSGQAQVRLLSFERQLDNSMIVRDANNGAVIDHLASADEGFIPGALRGLLYERRRKGQGEDQPFRLIASPGQGIALVDASTGLYMQLEAFGSANAKALHSYLHQSAVVNK